ncbi:hypothetical protein, partial [Microbulbifer mangrovi]|uniref:hypothetical protein n=1 Tax=Microbulbifer mangrovi TaxID=927787 RepID=UPI00195A3A9D
NSFIHKPKASFHQACVHWRTNQRKTEKFSKIMKLKLFTKRKSLNKEAYGFCFSFSFGSLICNGAL